MFKLAIPPRSAICAAAVKHGLSVSYLLHRSLDGEVVWSPEIAHVRARWMSPVFVDELVAWAEAWDHEVVRGSCALQRLHGMELPHAIADAKQAQYQLPSPIPKLSEHSSRVHRHMGGPKQHNHRMLQRMHSYQQYRRLRRSE